MQALTNTFAGWAYTSTGLNQIQFARHAGHGMLFDTVASGHHAGWLLAPAPLSCGPLASEVIGRPHLQPFLVA